MANDWMYFIILGIHWSSKKNLVNPCWEGNHINSADSIFGISMIVCHLIFSDFNF